MSANKLKLASWN